MSLDSLLALFQKKKVVIGLLSLAKKQLVLLPSFFFLLLVGHDEFYILQVIQFVSTADFFFKLGFFSFIWKVKS